MLKSVIFAVLAMLVMAAPVTAEEARWEEIKQDEGITVWRMDVPGVPLPGFRGEADINASPEAVLAVIRATDKHTEWMHRCSDARLLDQMDENTTIVYNRTDSPWPAWDRDVILRTEVTREEQQNRIRLAYQNIDSNLVEKQDGVVRMPRLEGAYTMTEIQPGVTRVSYLVEVDVGGSLPGWIASLIARDLPFKTLDALRSRVEGKEEQRAAGFGNESVRQLAGKEI